MRAKTHKKNENERQVQYVTSKNKDETRVVWKRKKEREKEKKVGEYQGKIHLPVSPFSRSHKGTLRPATNTIMAESLIFPPPRRGKGK